MGLSWASHSTLIHTSELIPGSTICVHSATRHNIHIKLRVFLVAHIVAMVTCFVTKIIPRCSPGTEQFFDTMIVASIDKE